LSQRSIDRFNIVARLNELKKDLALREAELTIEVSLDDEGKKKYSNESLRKAKLETMKAEDETYRKIEESIKEVEETLIKHDAETRLIESSLKIYWAWVRLIEAKLKGGG